MVGICKWEKQDEGRLINLFKGWEIACDATRLRCVCSCCCAVRLLIWRLYRPRRLRSVEHIQQQGLWWFSQLWASLVKPAVEGWLHATSWTPHSADLSHLVVCITPGRRHSAPFLQICKQRLERVKWQTSAGLASQIGLTLNRKEGWQWLGLEWCMEMSEQFRDIWMAHNEWNFVIFCLFKCNSI